MTSYAVFRLRWFLHRAVEGDFCTAGAILATTLFRFLACYSTHHPAEEQVTVLMMFLMRLQGKASQKTGMKKGKSQFSKGRGQSGGGKDKRGSSGVAKSRSQRGGERGGRARGTAGGRSSGTRGRGGSDSRRGVSSRGGGRGRGRGRGAKR